MRDCFQLCCSGTTASARGALSTRAPSTRAALHAVFTHTSVSRQVVAHHYCAHINQDMRQCVIYDSDKKDARASLKSRFMLHSCSRPFGVSGSVFLRHCFYGLAGRYIACILPAAEMYLPRQIRPVR